MDAIVLVGGEGTRLRPLTYHTPKQMLPVVDRPMIEHVVGRLGAFGVTRAILSLGYRPDAFLEAYPDGELGGIELVYAIEPELLDTAGAVRYAANEAGVSETFLVINGDVLTDFDVAELVEFHRAHEAVGSLHLTPVEDPSMFGVVPVDPEGRVTAFIEKPPAGEEPTNLINAGCYVLEPEVLDRIETGRRVSIERETFPLLVAEGGLYGLASEAYWLDTGTPAKFLEGSLDILRGLRTPSSAPRATEVAPGRYVCSSAVCEGEAGPATFLGEGAVVAEGAEVSECVIGPGAVVGAGAKVSRSMVMAGTQVGPEAVVDESIVGPGATIGAGAHLEGFTVIEGRSALGAGEYLFGGRYPRP